MPGADVLVDRGGEQVGQRAERRGRPDDVREEARMAGQDRVLEDEVGRLFEQPLGRLAAARQPARAEPLADRVRSEARTDAARPLAREKVRDAVDQTAARLPKLLRGHLGGLAPEPVRALFAAQVRILSRTSS